jgi:hypothetical protein
MNKLRLPAFLLLFASFVTIVQSCNKDTVTGTAYTNAAFQANINGVEWSPDSVSASITYNSAAQSKTFYCIGTKSQKQIIFSVALPNATNTAGFPIGTYTIDSLSVKAQYNTQQLSDGSYVFLPHGTVWSGAGKITISAVDSVKKQITGTFYFNSKTITYDNSGNILSTTNDNILGGAFTSLPYTFTSN